MHATAPAASCPSSPAVDAQCAQRVHPPPVQGCGRPGCKGSGADGPVWQHLKDRTYCRRAARARAAPAQGAGLPDIMKRKEEERLRGQ